MMATYAPNGTNDATPTNYSLLSGKSPNRYHLSRIFRKRGMRELSDVLDTLLDDATPASTATVVNYQVQAVADTSANVQGGVRTIEAKQKVGLVLDSAIDDASAATARAVTAADVTTIQKMLEGGTDQKRSPTYPTDASGNGGGGKLSGDAY